MDEHTDGQSEWVRGLDVTNRREGRFRRGWGTGRPRRDAFTALGETGLVLTYALELNVDWQQPANLSCHSSWRPQTLTCHAVPGLGTSCHQDRSKIDSFPAGLDLNKPLEQTSICYPTCLHWDHSVLRCFCFCYLFVCVCVYVCVVFQERVSVLWGGGRSVFFHWFRWCHSWMPPFHYVKNICFDESFSATANWWQQQS